MGLKHTPPPTGRRAMDYRQPIFSVVLIIMLIACPPSAKCNGQGDGEVGHSSSSTRVVYEHRDVVSQGEQHYRLFESHHRVQEGGTSTSVQNNAKINIETSVHHSNEDKVLVHQQQKGQRQKLNKHGNEIIINPRCVSLCTGAVIAINRL